jgi:hypothetical protein
MLMPATMLHEARFPKEVPPFIQRLREIGLMDYEGHEISNYIPKSKLSGERLDW